LEDLLVRVHQLRNEAISTADLLQHTVQKYLAWEPYRFLETKDTLTLKANYVKAVVVFLAISDDRSPKIAAVHEEIDDMEREFMPSSIGTTPAELSMCAQSMQRKFMEIKQTADEAMKILEKAIKTGKEAAKTRA